LVEAIKKAFEHLTGMACPDRSELRLKKAKPERYSFRDDGRTPNNPAWPLLVYRQIMELDSRFDPAAQFEVLFASNDWTGSWRDGMYRFNHFHTQTHEVLGFARGRILSLFGGNKGREVELIAGDVVIIPAGVGHKRLNASTDILIVGAYPADGSYDEPRPGEITHKKAIVSIREVVRPASDPVFGKGGPLLDVWR